MALGYLSKEEKKIPINDPSGKWSDMTLLPEWEEKYYNVYTARKHGKWVMLKALKPEFADDPKYRGMLDREFETRYNLAHPNIVMVNDYEEIPGVGRAIVTDDAYGYSLRRLIDERRLTPKILRRLETQLLDAISYLQENHVIHYPISPDNIIFTEYTENLKLLNVGYDQKEELTPLDTSEDISAYGEVLNEVLDHCPTRIPRLRRIANRCMASDPIRRYRSVPELRLSIEHRSNKALIAAICAFIAAMAVLVVWLVKSN